MNLEKFDVSWRPNLARLLPSSLVSPPGARRELGFKKSECFGRNGGGDRNREKRASVL
jgi:hypothetical protein